MAGSAADFSNFLATSGSQPNWGAIQWQQDRVNDAAVEKRDRQAKYNQWLQDTMRDAPQMGRGYAASLGLDPNNPQVMQAINSIVGNINSGVERDLENINPEKFYNEEAFKSGFADQASKVRSQNVNRVRNTYSPGFESSLLPDSMIDDIVNSIVSEQRGQAGTSLDYQSKRGLLRPQGTEQAMRSLGNQESAARSTVGDLARGVLDKNRSSISDIVSKAGTAASEWDFGMNDFSLDPYRTQIDTAANRARSNFGGDVRAALGDTNLFDLPSVIAQAGTAQGANNLNIGDAVVPGDAKRQQTSKRGLGNAGGGF